MITLKLRDIVDNIGLLQDFSQQKMSAVAAYKAARLLGQLTDEYNLFQKSRSNLIDKYCEKDENGQMKVNGDNATIKKECIPEFEKEMQSLLDTKLEFNCSKFTLNELENLEFTPGQMYMLKNFIEE
jgi:hypothetical protein